MEHVVSGQVTHFHSLEELLAFIRRVLPAAPGDFSITMRVYWPKPAMLDGSWTPPPVKAQQAKN